MTKHAYYLLQLEKKIEKCNECPCVDPSGLGYWCNILKQKVPPKGKFEGCSLIFIEGKVEQN